MGLIRKFNFGDGCSRYELTTEAHKGHHHHLICTRCGRIIDYNDFMEKEVKFIKELEAELATKYKFKINYDFMEKEVKFIKELEAELATKYKFKINSHQIYFYGLLIFLKK